MGTAGRQHSTGRLLNRLRMRQVALILAIDDVGTLRGAAAHLGLSQPAATKMLHELESTLGQRLFEREGRGLRLNAAGARVTGYFRGLRGSVEALNRDLAELGEGASGHLAIGSIMAASPGRLTDALVALKREFPLLSVEIAVDSSDRLMDQLREGVLELVVGRLTALPGIDCRFTAIEDEALAVVCGVQHPLARRRRVDFASLLDHPWILQPRPSPMRDVIEREFRRHHQRLPRGLIETGSILTTISLVGASDFLGVIPHSVARRDEKHGVLRVLPYRFREKLESYGTLEPKDRPLSATAARFLQLLHKGLG